jgi:hypothetical protein
MTNHLEVSPLQESRIAPIRQPRLLIADTQEAWPEDIWDALPPDVQREVLRHLARLLTRWLGLEKRQR